MRSHLIGLITLAIASFGSIVTAQDETLSMPERAMIQKLTGEWKIVAAFVDGRPFDYKVNAIGARFDSSGMQFVTRVEERDEPKWSYDEIRLEDNEVDIVVRVKDSLHRYALTLEGNDLWLATKSNENSDLPDHRKPAVGVFALKLERKTE